MGFLNHLTLFCIHPGVHLWTIYVQSLVNLLYDSATLSKANSFSRSLHEHCIQRLTVSGRLYPQLFKTTMAASPDLKQSLTAGIKANESMKIARFPSAGNRLAAPQKPKIALNMDFSNFK